MLPETDQAAIQADAYIDALLAGHGRVPTEIVSIVIRPRDAGTRAPDRRLLVGGAIASGVSIASAAVIAWRRTRHLSGSAD